MGLSLIFITHDFGIVAKMCDRVAVRSTRRHRSWPMATRSPVIYTEGALVSAKSKIILWRAWQIEGDEQRAVELRESLR